MAGVACVLALAASAPAAHADPEDIEGVTIDVGWHEQSAIPHLKSFARWIKRYVPLDAECKGKLADEWCTQLVDDPGEAKLQQPLALTNWNGKEWVALPAAKLADKRAKVRGALLSLNVLTSLKGRIGAEPFDLVRTRLTVAAMVAASERVLADWAAIEKVFFPGTKLTKVAAFEIMNSDPHKGGRQVIKLVFDSDKGPQSLIYKPGDLEFDALIAGDLKALRERLGDGTPAVPAPFDAQAASVVEIFNTAIAGPKQTERLATYLILPRNPGSKLLLKDGAIDLRQSYGYSQFLGPSAAAGWGLSPDKTDLTAAGTAAYTKVGSLAAIAFALDIRDLHNDNVHMEGQTPYFIDLEVGLLEPAETLENLQLVGIGKAYGINTVYASIGQPWGTRVGGEDGQEAKVWKRGFCAATEMIYAEHKSFLPVFDRLKGVVTRLLFSGTQPLGNLRDIIHPDLVDKDEPGEPGPIGDLLAEYVQQGMMNPALSPAGWPVGKDGTAVSVAPYYQALAKDFAEGDIPAFFHRASDPDVLDSRGAPIKVIGKPSGTSVFDKPPLDGLRAHFESLGKDATLVKQRLAASGVTCPAPSQPR